MAGPKMPTPSRSHPVACEVLVLGAGLAGLQIAGQLAEEGVDVVLIDPRGLLDGATGRGLGLLRVGTAEAPHRLIEALGHARARELVDFSRVSARTFSGLLPERRGLLRVAQRLEIDELAQAVAASEALGLPCAALTQEEVGAALGLDAPGPGRRVEGDACFEPAALLRVLDARARAAGVRVLRGRAVEALDLEEQVLARLEGGTLRCELAVLAGGAELSALEPALGPCLSPVRHQVFEARGLPASPGLGLSASHGHLAWNPLHPEGLLVGGARWGSPHMEVGERDDSVVVEGVHRALEGWARGVLGPFEVGERWSRIETWSCDGLPLVGPLPGHSRLLACTGFGDDEAALAGAAARAIVQGILGQPVELPAFLRAGRFVA